MELSEVIKEAFIFPSNNLKQLAIYIILTLIITLLSVGGVVSIFGIASSGAYGIFSAILLIIAIIISFITIGYQISLIESGIKSQEEAPEFDFKANLITGVKALIVKIVYYIIPAIITGIIAFATGVPQNFAQLITSSAEVAADTTLAENTTFANTIPANAASALVGSLAVTATIGIILFIIFEFIALMAQARLANTDSLGSALHIGEAFKDIGRIGYGNVICTVVLACLIVIIINGIVAWLGSQVPVLSILSVIVTPYMIFFTYRVIGSLYSEIA